MADIDKILEAEKTITTILEELSKDAPRKYIDRLNKALERALFKEEDQRPIKSETIKSSKYYVPRFGVIDAQLS